MKSRAKPNNNSLEILLVEDSPTQAENLRHLLEVNGYQVRIVGNGREALAAVENGMPALVISDIVMPEMDGYEFCKEIKSRGQSTNLPVILLTSLSGPEDIIKGLQCGADSFIKKPYNGADLLSRLDYVLTNRELRKTDKVQFGIEIELAGQKHFITAERQQILDLLISTFEDAVQLNKQLAARERELAKEILERQRAEQAAQKLNVELQATNKELESFSYSVSHDLQSPLRHIMGFSQLLAQNCGDKLDLQAKHYLELICDATQRMEQLIKDLLEISRVTRSEMHYTVVDLSGLAQAIANELNESSTERKVEFVVEPGLKNSGDPRLLRIVLENLFNNAWKFTVKRLQAKIEFGLTKHNGKPVYFMRDNGAGFDMKYAGKLFGAFQRLHDAADYPGTGIGLATVQRIISRHGGQVWAEGAVEKGATFYFSLGNKHEDKSNKGEVSVASYS
jgi:two-component system sensor histidine kinase/response regulator